MSFNVASPCHGVRRFHILYALRYFKYLFIVSLLPIVTSLFSLQFQNLISSIYQSIFILSACISFSVLLWYFTRFHFDKHSFYKKSGIFYQKITCYNTSFFSGIEIKRSLVCRILRASKITLFTTQGQIPARLTIYLSKQDAQTLAECFMPVHHETSVYTPSGAERLNFILLSANLITSALFFFMTLHQIDEVLSKNLAEIAVENFSKLTAFLSRWLPAGLSAFMGLFFLIVSITLLFAFLQTFGFSVCRNGGIILAKGGLITKIERRIRLQTVTYCEMRITPIARFLRCCAVYLRAGSFYATDIPFMICPLDSLERIQILLPDFTLPTKPLCLPKAKSPWQYVWFPTTVLSFLLLITALAFYFKPMFAPVPLFFVLINLFWLFVEIEGILKEGICKNKNQTFSLSKTHFITRKEYCIFTHDMSFYLFQSPFAIKDKRCTMTVHLPGYSKIRVRGMVMQNMKDLPFPI